MLARSASAIALPPSEPMKLLCKSSTVMGAAPIVLRP